VGSRNIPHLYIYKIKTMKIEKKIIRESVGNDLKGYKTYSNKKQNIVITESQLEKILEKLQNNGH
jgi:hypothetical protein